MLKQIASEARGARASDFERSRAWFKRAMKREARDPRAREARARACSEARIVALIILTRTELNFKKWFHEFLEWQKSL